MRRYELMLVLRPDVADDKSQAIVDRTTRGIVACRRPDREGRARGAAAAWPTRSIATVKARTTSSCSRRPSEAIVELEHTLLITEEVLRHLVTRVDRPAKAVAGRRGGLRRARRRGPRAEHGRGRRGRSAGRVHRRVRERGGSGRHRLTGGQHHGVLQGHDHRQPRTRSRDALHADRQARHAVQRGRQPVDQEPADRRVDRGDGLVPRQRLR